MPQNKVAGKRQISTYLPEDVYEALLLRAAREKTTRSEVVERALRKELGMVAKLTWQVIEDSGGGLHLVVFEADSDRVIYYADGYEHNEDGLRADLDALRNGADPRTGGWEMPGDVDDPQTAYDGLTSYECGWVVVADDEGVYPERMGAAAQRVFGVFGDSE